MLRYLQIIVLQFAVSACSSFIGVGCGDADEYPEITGLIRQACSGDRDASFQLGDMFERGDGVIQDEKRARRYYEVAAAPSSGTSYIYVPGAGSVAGYTMPVTTGTPHPGHAGAIYRLGVMLKEGRGGTKDVERAEAYFRRAAALGHSGTLR